MEKVSSASGLMVVSRKGMEPSSLVSSTVNWMEGSNVLMWWRNSSFCEWCWITKVSSTYLFQILGGAVLLKWLCSQMLPCIYWSLLDLLVTPWLLLLFVHKPHLGTQNRCNRANVGHYGPQGDILLMYLWQPIELWRTGPCRIHFSVGVFLHHSVSFNLS